MGFSKHQHTKDVKNRHHTNEELIVSNSIIIDTEVVVFVILQLEVNYFVVFYILSNHNFGDI